METEQPTNIDLIVTIISSCPGNASDCQIVLLCVILRGARPASFGHVFSLCEMPMEGIVAELSRAGDKTQMSDGRDHRFRFTSPLMGVQMSRIDRGSHSR